MKKIYAIGTAAAVAGLMVAGGATAAQAVEPNGSDAPIWSYDGLGNGASSWLSSTYQHTWTDNYVGVASPTDDMVGEICPADAVGYSTFVSLRGEERDVTKWISQVTWDLTGPQQLQVPMSFGDLPPGAKDTIKANGGNYSLGISCISSKAPLTRASTGTFYNFVTVTAGTGAWTMETPAVAGPTGPQTDADLTPANQGTLTITGVNGSKIVSIDAGAANAGKTFKVAVFSNAVALPDVTLDAAGTGQVDLTSANLPEGTSHKLALWNAGDGSVAAWNTFTVPNNAPDPGATLSNSTLNVAVTASNRFELQAPANLNVDLGNVKRNRTTTPVKLGAFKVIDDRDVLAGWNLNVSALDFVNQADNTKTIGKAALGYSPIGTALPSGITAGAAQVAGSANYAPSALFASGAANSSTSEDGADFDADLTFKAPIDAVKGAYKSTLTMTLISQ